MNVLTIDLEDWFHILAHEETGSPHQWEKFESRVVRNTEWILEQLGFYRQPATFFCLGWIAKRYPELIKKIVQSGHEIACHSMNHQLVFQQTPALFRDDLIRSMQLLEEVSGRKVITYRAPGFSVSEKTKWFFDVLLECGIQNDCSVFPLARNHGGYVHFPSRAPCLINIEGGQLKEFPMSFGNFAGKKFVYSGGGYFRLLPYAVIRSQARKSAYVMTYFHPRDFDAGQPVLSSLPWKRKMMSYVGLKGAGKKFTMLLNDFRFVSVQGAVESIDWSRVPVVSPE